MSVLPIQLSNHNRHPRKGDTIRYIYKDSQHKNPLSRVEPVENTHQDSPEEPFDYDKEKYKEMILDADRNCIRIFWF